MELIIILLIPILLNTLSINDRLNKIIELLERNKKWQKKNMKKSF